MLDSILHQIYSIHSETGHEWPMIAFVREYVKEHIHEAEVQIDMFGNLYITKGEARVGYPTLACHLDQVQKLHSNDFEVQEKNGIWVCLRCLEECPRLKVFMAVGEEKGCIGSNRADMSFFSDSFYVLEPDCKGGEEVHTNLRGIPYASTIFEEALQLDKYGYVITDGKTSDILALNLNNIGVSCANIPVSYYLPHKDDEYTVMAELEKCFSFVLHIINTLGERFSHIYKSETQLMIEKELFE